jgi:nitrite reductase/ring-hydroxylating ferredoxin subunit
MSEVFVGTTHDFADDARKGVRFDGREVFVFQHRDRYYAYENNCPHAGGPVGEGTVIGKVEAVLDDDRNVLGERFSETEFNIVCPWHGYEYDIETGRCAGDGRIRLRKYSAYEKDGNVYVAR